MFDFEISTREVGGFIILDLEGEINIYNGRTLRNALNELLEQGEAKVIINLKDVKYLDSSGIGILLSGLTRFKKEQGKFLLCNCWTGYKDRV